MKFIKKLQVIFNYYVQDTIYGPRCFIHKDFGKNY